MLGGGLAAAAAAWSLVEQGAEVALLEPSDDRSLGARSTVVLPGSWSGEGASAAIEVRARVRRRGVATAVEGRATAVSWDGAAWVARDDGAISAPHLVAAPEPASSSRLPHCARYYGRGLTVCAWSDAPFLSGRVVVTGDGVAAIDAARLVARFASPLLVGAAPGAAEELERIDGRLIDVEGADAIQAAVVEVGGRRVVIPCSAIVEAYDPVLDDAASAALATLRLRAPESFCAAGLLAGIAFADEAALVASGCAAARAITSRVR